MKYQILAILSKKNDYNTKVNEIEKKITEHNHEHKNNHKYITNPGVNKSTAENVAERLAQANLVTKTGYYNKLLNLNRIIASNKTKHLLVENELKKFETFDSVYFRVKSHFKDDDTQNLLVFQPIHR